ncbi:50S ribosomal protein L25/general stress protein Ctc [Lachnoclostridium sp. An131]|uniref:50S ribosomal protein L25 n=1 Tax=Lachnoclostridium sp. An131 TaxID=1965555 RepID=UPI000B372480|nr:50S ribosomal protein L25 [Lachnoclostridium sp. An131]OUQ25632.1 50S ribosomal protein L25/general stress protein Ctc [Lachnoclostridium sp. An131]
MNTLKAEKRDMTTKAKKLRREGYVTGVIYGREMKESIPLKMEKPAVERVLKTGGKGSQVMLEVDGQTYDALIKEIDYDSLKGQLLEVDFQALVSNEKVHSVAEIILLNHEAVQEGVIQQMLQEVSYRALPADLVDKIKIDVSSMKVGDTLKVEDLEIAKNPEIDLQTPLDAAVATVIEVRTAPAEDESEEAAEA